jgi:hypothetical protein
MSIGKLVRGASILMFIYSTEVRDGPAYPLVNILSGGDLLLLEISIKNLAYLSSIEPYPNIAATFVGDYTLIGLLIDGVPALI